MEPTSALVDWPDECVFADVQHLQASLRRLGFDLSQAAYVTHQVSSPTWEQASAIATDARRDGWRCSVFVDHARWVVRLVWFAVPTPQLISRTCRYVDTLARRHGSEARGFSIEDPRRDDCWMELAERVVGPPDDLEREPTRITAHIPARGRDVRAAASRGA